MENRVKYQGKVEAQLSEWGTELGRLKTRTGKATASARHGYYDQIKPGATSRHRNKGDYMKRSSSAAAWEDLQDGLDLAWTQVKDSSNKTAARSK